MGLPVKNLRDGTITIQVDNDGGGNAGSVEVTLDQGDLSWTEARPVEMHSDRGTLSHARRAVQDQLLELTFSMMYTDHLDPNSAVPTVYEALTRQGAAASWVSQTQDSDDFSVNLEFVVTDPAGGDSEELNFDKFNVTGIDFTEGDPSNVLTVTGTAPLYWPDFWWRPADGINPSIGQHGTFSRASAATYLDALGEVQYARSGEFRPNHFPSLTAGRTGLLEAQRTNLALMSEALGGSDWTASNVTVGDDEVAGPDGNTTAESLTASAGNGTLIQDLGVIGSAATTFSIWLKRKTGTQDIELTLDGGAGWTMVVVTSTWTRFEITQTLANPDIGIRIVLDTDAVYAWGAQAETAAFPSSYIPTTLYPLDGDGFLEFSGAAGNFASSADSADVSVTGDIEIQGRIAADDYTPGANEVIVAKWMESGDQRAYRLMLLTTGILRLSWSTDGAAGTVVSVDSTVAISTANGEINWGHATLDVSTGNVNFYTSADGENKTLLGAADQGGAGATSIDDGTAVLEIGSQDGGTVSPFTGKVYRVRIYASLDGSALAFDVDPQDLTTHGADRITLTEKANSADVTVFSTSAAATRVKDDLYFPLPINISTPQESTWLFRLASWVSAYVSGTVSHIGSATAASDPRWDLDVDASGDILANYDGGSTDAETSVVTSPADGEDMEFRTTLSAAGVVGLGSATDGGAEVVETPASGDALGAAWADTRLYLNSTGSTVPGFGNYAEVIGARRTRTLAQLRKVG